MTKTVISDFKEYLHCTERSTAIIIKKANRKSFIFIHIYAKKSKYEISIIKIS